MRLRSQTLIVKFSGFTEVESMGSERVRATPDFVASILVGRLAGCFVLRMR